MPDEASTGTQAASRGINHIHFLCSLHRSRRIGSGLERLNGGPSKTGMSQKVNGLQECDRPIKDLDNPSLKNPAWGVADERRWPAICLSELGVSGSPKEAWTGTGHRHSGPPTPNRRVSSARGRLTKAGMYQNTKGLQECDRPIKDWDSFSRQRATLGEQRTNLQIFNSPPLFLHRSG